MAVWSVHDASMAFLNRYHLPSIFCLFFLSVFRFMLLFILSRECFQAKSTLICQLLRQETRKKTKPGWA